MARRISFAAAAMIALGFAPGDADARNASAAHQFCAMQWASDRARMTDCVDRQIDGARDVVRYLDWAKASPGPDGRHVIDMFELCNGRWAPDFEQVSACLRARSLIAPPQ
ncbi:MAG: hypothetical protein AAFU55_00050 [Pseudomonadota bacterium]